MSAPCCNRGCNRVAFDGRKYCCRACKRAGMSMPGRAEKIRTLRLAGATLAAVAAEAGIHMQTAYRICAELPSGIRTI